MRPLRDAFLEREHKRHVVSARDLCCDTGRRILAKEKRQALRTLEDVAGIMRRVMGPAHPDTLHAQRKRRLSPAPAPSSNTVLRIKPTAP